MKPKISIIVPVYNVEKYIDKCIESILSQTLNEFELILVNDGSTDSSGKICDEYATKDSRIKVIHKNNGGVSSARNVGIDIATGDYIGFVDPDDDIDKNMYKTMFDYTYDKTIDIVICKIKTINEITNTISESKIWENTNCIIDKKEIECKLIPGVLKDSPYSINSSFNKIYKKEVFKSLNLRFDEKKHHGEDSRLNLIALSKIEKVVFVDEALYNYYIRKRASLTQSFRMDLYEYILDNMNFGVHMCKTYNLENQIPNYIDVYISNTLNYIQDIATSDISFKDKYKLVSYILNDTTFNRNIYLYRYPSRYYRVLKQIAIKENAYLLLVIALLKKKIQYILKGTA